MTLEWWNGRHEGFKIPWPYGRAGSSPASSTSVFNMESEIILLDYDPDWLMEDDDCIDDQYDELWVDNNDPYDIYD